MAFSGNWILLKVVRIKRGKYKSSSLYLVFYLFKDIWRPDLVFLPLHNYLVLRAGLSHKVPMKHTTVMWQNPRRIKGKCCLFLWAPLLQSVLSCLGLLSLNPCRGKLTFLLSTKRNDWGGNHYQECHKAWFSNVISLLSKRTNAACWAAERRGSSKSFSL